MLGNPRARQIPWKSPHNVDPTSLFYRWKNAQTGYPIIDAIITELNTTGWIHYLARDTVARFLTRGEYCHKMYIQTMCALASLGSRCSNNLIDKKNRVHHRILGIPNASIKHVQNLNILRIN